MAKNTIAEFMMKDQLNQCKVENQTDISFPDLSIYSFSKLFKIFDGLVKNGSKLE